MSLGEKGTSIGILVSLAFFLGGALVVLNSGEKTYASLRNENLAEEMYCDQLCDMAAAQKTNQGFWKENVPIWGTKENIEEEIAKTPAEISDCECGVSRNAGTLLHIKVCTDWQGGRKNCKDYLNEFHLTDHSPQKHIQYNVPDIAHHGVTGEGSNGCTNSINWNKVRETEGCLVLFTDKYEHAGVGYNDDWNCYVAKAEPGTILYQYDNYEGHNLDKGREEVVSMESVAGGDFNSFPAKGEDYYLALNESVPIGGREMGPLPDYTRNLLVTKTDTQPIMLDKPLNCTKMVVDPPEVDENVERQTDGEEERDEGVMRTTRWEVIEKEDFEE